MRNMFMGALQELNNWNRHEQTEVDRKLTIWRLWQLLPSSYTFFNGLHMQLHT